VNKTLGYMVTWTTYGTWLEGEKKGYVKKGQILEGNETLREKSKRNQKDATVRLSKKQRSVVSEAILAGAARTGENVFAIAVLSNHVHIVVHYNGKPIGRTVSRLKKTAYYAMRECGFRGRLWTRGYDRRYCFDEESLRARVDYVKRHK
jgi:REP element-mobilizing transposase RayT